jgi:hypothetical protein
METNRDVYRSLEERIEEEKLRSLKVLSGEEQEIVEAIKERLEKGNAERYLNLFEKYFSSKGNNPQEEASNAEKVINIYTAIALTLFYRPEHFEKLDDYLIVIKENIIEKLGQVEKLITSCSEGRKIYSQLYREVSRLLINLDEMKSEYCIENTESIKRCYLIEKFQNLLKDILEEISRRLGNYERRIREEKRRAEIPERLFL